MKYVHKLWARVAAAILIGFLLAGAGTKISYPCAPTDGYKGCVSFEKALMHPSDLMNNEQDSLVKFSTDFVMSSLIAFGLISVINMGHKKKR